MKKNVNILFSVIIPTYNRDGIIGRAIESVLAQTYQNWELIIVDDGSTDNTREIVESYKDDRIRYFWKENEERSIARNYGIDKAKGAYISFLDDDDYYLPEFLATFHKSIIENNIPFAAFTCFEYTENNGVKSKNNIPVSILNNPVKYLWEIQTSIRPFAIHKDILKEEKFKSDCKYGQDFHLAIRIALKYKIFIIEEYLSVNITHTEQGTQSKFKRNYRTNAELSLMCINDLVHNNINQLKESIAIRKINDLINHKIYGFASASMKHCDFGYLFSLIKSIKFNSSPGKTAYYLFSIALRTPFYLIKCIFAGNED